jgi:hypothetical protein
MRAEAEKKGLKAGHAVQTTELRLIISNDPNPPIFWRSTAFRGDS